MEADILEFLNFEMGSPTIRTFLRCVLPFFLHLELACTELPSVCKMVIMLKPHNINSTMIVAVLH